MENYEHIVLFCKYCPTCKYLQVEETEDPCNECLTTPVRECSRKPINWEGRENHGKD